MHAMTDGLPFTSDSIDLTRIERAADYAEDMLARFNYADVELCPGDATSYKVLVVGKHTRLCGGCQPPDFSADGHTHRRPHLVCHYSDFGTVAYPWDGRPLHWTYVMEKWCRGTSRTDEHTAAVLTYYLNTLAGLLDS